MVARMTYFRTKWLDLPAAYAQFLAERLMPGAPVLLVEDGSRWPVTRIGERHVFQAGAQGGRDPAYYLKKPHTPQPDEQAPEAEWGAAPELGEAVERWCRLHDHPLVRLCFVGPQAPAGPAATTIRNWHRDGGRAADRLVVPSFVLGDPWTTLVKGAVPFWTFFGVEAALASLRSYLDEAPPYRHIDIMLFQHGIASAGIAEPDSWLRVAEAHGAHARLLGLDPRRFPHDIATIARYGPALRDLPDATMPWTPLDVHAAIDGLASVPGVTIADR